MLRSGRWRWGSRWPGRTRRRPSTRRLQSRQGGV